MKVIYLLILIIFTISCAYGVSSNDDQSIKRGIRDDLSNVSDRSGDNVKQRIANAVRVVRNKRLFQDRLKKQYYPPGRYYINGLPQSIVQPRVGVLHPIPVPVATNHVVLRPYPYNIGSYLPTQLLPYQPPQFYSNYLNYGIPSNYIQPQFKLNSHILTPYIPPSESRIAQAIPQAIPKTFYPLPRLDSDPPLAEKLPSAHDDNILVHKTPEDVTEVALAEKPLTENPVINSITTRNNDYFATENSPAENLAAQIVRKNDPVTENPINTRKEQYSRKSEKVQITEKIKGIKDCPCLQKLFNITEMDNGAVKQTFDCTLIQRILNNSLNSPSTQKITKMSTSEIARLKQKFIPKPKNQGKLLLQQSPLATDLYPPLPSIIAPNASPDFKVFVLPPAMQTYTRGISPNSLIALQNAYQQYSPGNEQLPIISQPHFQTLAAPVFSPKYPDMKEFIINQISAYDLQRKQELLDKLKGIPKFQPPSQASDYDGYAKAVDRNRALLSPKKDKAPLEFLRDLSAAVENVPQKEFKYENSGPFGDALPLPDYPEIRADFNKEKRIKKIKRKGPEIQYYDENASGANVS